jgi:N-carbamoyl-L-amino-acid hydrolase
MDLRKDALEGAAELVLSRHEILAEVGGPKSVATVGKLVVSPGAPNAIPGAVEMTLEVRDSDGQVLDALEEAFRERARGAAERRGLSLEMERVSRIAPVSCDQRVVDAVRHAAQALDAETLQMPSGAAHDTQMMAAVAPVGMVFVPSRGGRSHAPEEHTDPAELELGANVLLQSLCTLAGPE